MRISGNSYRTKNLMRYYPGPAFFSSFFPDSGFHRHPFYNFTSLYNSSFVPSICCFESDPPQREQLFGNFLYVSPSICTPNSRSFYKNYYNFSDSLVGLSSSCKFGSQSLYNKQVLCKLASGPPSKICSLVPPFSGSSLGFCSICKHNYNCICSYSGSVHLLGIQCVSYFRSFSLLSSDPTSISDPVEEVQSVGAVTDDVKLEETKMDRDGMNPRSISVLEIVDIISNGGMNWESRLRKAASELNVNYIIEIFEVLNSQRIPGLRFFEWVRRNKHKLRMNADVCSLIINNCGCLNDYQTMSSLLKGFSFEKICLTHKAFGFLPVLASTNESLAESVRRVVDLLNEVGGSCRNSGICGLIEMFCKSDLFNMAKYVIQITEKKDSYYNILIRENCKRGRVEDARGIISEMRESGYAPSAKTYNYLIGNLCKNNRMDDVYMLLEEMNSAGIRPDASTFGVLIHFSCHSGEVDVAYKFLDQMVSAGLEPLLMTHTKLVKAWFIKEKYEEAHKYVVDSSAKYKTSGNMIYSFLVNLYREKCDIMSAQNVLVEMMEKDLKPNFSSYINILKCLAKSGRANLAADLKGRYSKLDSGSHPRSR